MTTPALSQYRFVSTSTQSAPESRYAERISRQQWRNVEDSVRQWHSEHCTRQMILCNLARLEPPLHPTRSQLARRMKKWNLTVYKARESSQHQLSPLTISSGQSERADTPTTPTATGLERYWEVVRKALVTYTCLKQVLDRQPSADIALPYVLCRPSRGEIPNAWLAHRAAVAFLPEEMRSGHSERDCEVLAGLLSSADLCDKAFSVYRYLCLSTLLKHNEEEMSTATPAAEELFARSLINCLKTATKLEQVDEAKLMIFWTFSFELSEQFANTLFHQIMTNLLVTRGDSDDLHPLWAVEQWNEQDSAVLRSSVGCSLLCRFEVPCTRECLQVSAHSVTFSNGVPAPSAVLDPTTSRDAIMRCLVWCVSCVEDVQAENFFCPGLGARLKDKKLADNPRLCHRYLIWYFLSVAAMEKPKDLEFVIEGRFPQFRLDLYETLSVVASLLGTWIAGHWRMQQYALTELLEDDVKLSLHLHHSLGQTLFHRIDEAYPYAAHDDAWLAAICKITGRDQIETAISTKWISLSALTQIQNEAAVRTKIDQRQDQGRPRYTTRQDCIVGLRTPIQDKKLHRFVKESRKMANALVSIDEQDESSEAIRNALPSDLLYDHPHCGSPSETLARRLSLSSTLRSMLRIRDDTSDASQSSQGTKANSRRNSVMSELESSSRPEDVTME